jgi:hypothetical protein
VGEHAPDDERHGEGEKRQGDVSRERGRAPRSTAGAVARDVEDASRHEATGPVLTVGWLGTAGESRASHT